MTETLIAPTHLDSDGNPLPDLNVELVFNLVRWAEIGEALDAEEAEMFRTWGIWNQGAWAIAGSKDYKKVRNGECQTAFCMAGQAVVQADYRLVHFNEDKGRHLFSNGLEVNGRSTESCIKVEPTGEYDKKGRMIYEDAPNAVIERIPDVAQKVLGLEYYERGLFFDGDNELWRLKELANMFCVARGLPLLFPEDSVAEDDIYQLV